MANYTAADIKALRESTGAGMLDVKNALDEADGDRDKATEIIRVKGLKGITKREGRSASDGLVAIDVSAGGAGEVGTMVEVNSETDFVAKNEKFTSMAAEVLAGAVASGATDVETLMAAPSGARTVKDVVEGLAATIGEKLEVRRVARLESEKVAFYLHRTAKDLPPQIGVMVATDAAAGEIGKDVAMHIAAYSPTFLSREDVPADTIESERRIAEETARAEGKPEQALAKIVDGRMNGYFKENVLLDQPFSKDPKQTVGKIIAASGGTVTGFVRFRVGA